MSYIGKDLVLVGGAMFLQLFRSRCKNPPLSIRDGLCIFRSCALPWVKPQGWGDLSIALS